MDFAKKELEKYGWQEGKQFCFVFYESTLKFNF